MVSDIENAVDNGRELSLQGECWWIGVDPPRNVDMQETRLTVEPGNALEVTDLRPRGSLSWPNNRSSVEVCVSDASELARDDGVSRRARNIRVEVAYVFEYQPVPKGRGRSPCIFSAEFRRSNGEPVRLDDPRYSYLPFSDVADVDVDIVEGINGKVVQYRRFQGDSRPATIFLKVTPNSRNQPEFVMQTPAQNCGNTRVRASLDLGNPSTVGVLFPVRQEYSFDDERDTETLIGPVAGAAVSLNIPVAASVPVFAGAAVEHGGDTHRVRFLMAGSINLPQLLPGVQTALTYRRALPPFLRPRPTRPGPRTTRWLYFGVTTGLAFGPDAVQGNVMGAFGLSWSSRSSQDPGPGPLGEPRSSQSPLQQIP